MSLPPSSFHGPSLGSGLACDPTQQCEDVPRRQGCERRSQQTQPSLPGWCALQGGHESHQVTSHRQAPTPCLGPSGPAIPSVPAQPP